MLKFPLCPEGSSEPGKSSSDLNCTLTMAIVEDLLYFAEIVGETMRSYDSLVYEARLYFLGHLSTSIYLIVCSLGVANSFFQVVDSSSLQLHVHVRCR